VAVTQVGPWKFIVQLNKRTYEKDMKLIESLDEDYVYKEYLVEDGKYLTIISPKNLHDTSGFRSYVNSKISQVRE